MKKWRSAFLMVLNAVIQGFAWNLEGNVSPYHHQKMSLRGNWQGLLPTATEQQGPTFFQTNHQDVSLSHPMPTTFTTPPGNFVNQLHGQVTQPSHQRAQRKSTTIWNYLIGSAAENFGEEGHRFPLRPRTRGSFQDYERSSAYQIASQWCVLSNPAPYSFHSYLCSGVIDFGISLFIEAQILQDMLLCILSQSVVGDNMLCLSWLMLRLFFPQVLPSSFGSRRFYALMRKGLE